MSAKKILTVGVELASADTQYTSFASKPSLLDWDIILFKPGIGEFLSYSECYQESHALAIAVHFT